MLLRQYRVLASICGGAQPAKCPNWPSSSHIGPASGGSSSSSGIHTATYEVVIALGSNQGKRVSNLLDGLAALARHGIEVLRVSLLYETAAMYVPDQPAFLNAAVLGCTDLSPLQLLYHLKQIEKQTGRDLVSGRRWGPRPLDLDIIFYGAQNYQHEALTIPHIRWQERGFVQAPVADLLQPEDVRQGHIHELQGPGSVMDRLLQVQQHWEAAGGEAQVGSHGLYRVLPIQRQIWELGHTTHVCGILNITPDSFSDGGTHMPAVKQQQQQQQQQLLDTGQAAANSSIAGCSIHDHPQPQQLLQPQLQPKQVHAFSDLPPGHPSQQPYGVLPNASDSANAAFDFSSLKQQPPLPTAAATAPALASPTAAACTPALGIANVSGNVDVDVAGAIEAARGLARAGAQLIDVGGQSTRPGSARLTAEDELARIMPVIRALREDSELVHVPVSVDTYHSRVAQEAVAAGADMVNDVSGGTLDPAMFRTVASLGVPYCLMHMRGDPATMAQPPHTRYSCVWRNVGQELWQRAQLAVQAGILPWNLVLDPGLGFAKTAEGSAELLGHLAAMRREALQGVWGRMPLLVGPSRKKFIGKLTGRSDPVGRDLGTAAACVAAVAQGTEIVRVHNVAVVSEALRVADGVFRGSWPVTEL